MRTRTLLLVAVAVAVAVVSFVVAMPAVTASAATPEPIRVGTMAPLSG